MQDIADVFNQEIENLPHLTPDDLLRTTAKRTQELAFNNAEQPKWFGDTANDNAEILLFFNDEKAKKYEDRVDTYLKSGRDKTLLDPAAFSMLKFSTKEYIGRYEKFVVAVNVAPYLDTNGILICGPIKKDGKIFEKYQEWGSVDEDDLIALQKITIDRGIIAWGCFMLPSNKFAHFHFMSDTFENKKLPLVQAIDNGLYDNGGVRLASSGELSELKLHICVVDDAANALQRLQEAEVAGIKSDLYVIRGKFLLLHYKSHDNVVHYTFGRQWIPSPEGIGFTLHDSHMQDFSPTEIVKDFWVQKNSQLRPLN